MRVFQFICCVVLLFGTVAVAEIPSSQGRLRAQEILNGLNEPWGFAFLPGGEILITERGGRLILANDGQAQTIAGVPDVYVAGQGGLLDVMVPRDFAESREVFLSFSRQQAVGAGTALGVGQLSADGQSFDNFRVIFQMVSGGTGDRHFGSRIVEARDGSLFLTIGERAEMDAAQDLSRHHGKVIRINRDGSIPPDNPFRSTPAALPEIWSYGHRNPQGAALDLNGDLWVSEHGARGGDEVNKITAGANYGWPVIAYGTHYSGEPIGEGHEKDGMEQPEYYWDPSIAPSGLMIYSGRLWPEWRGNFFIGSLKSDFISRLDPGAGWAEERLTSAETGRVRDIREGPDGAIWFLSVVNGALYRVTPEN